MRPLASTLAILAFCGALCLPVAATILGPSAPFEENRAPAPAPGWPRAAGDLLRLPAASDAWLDDHFGFRNRLIRLNDRLRFALFGESANPQIAFGPDGTLFLTSHDRLQPQQMLSFLCRGDDNPVVAPLLATAAATFLDALLAWDPRAVEMMVPTKTVVEAQRLPGWMRARCRGGRPLLPAMLAVLSRTRPDLRAHVVYPLDMMRSLQGPLAPYPKANFHWDGAGLAPIAGLVAAGRFDRPLIAPLRRHMLLLPTDIPLLLPGVSLQDWVSRPDLAASGVEEAGLPELGETGRRLVDVSRFTRRDGKGPRLLVLSDSFGKALSPEFAAYYGDVWHVSVNGIAQLDAAQRAALWDALFRRYAPDDVLVVLHDFSQGFINASLAEALGRPPPRP